MKQYNLQDLQAQQQVMDVAGDWFTIRRKTFTKYDNYGRPIQKDTKESILGTLIPQTKNLQLSGKGHGEWVPTTFKFVCVQPYYVIVGDLMETNYGVLRVDSIDDTSNYGNITANLTRTGSMENISNKGDY